MEGDIPTSLESQLIDGGSERQGLHFATSASLSTSAAVLTKSSPLSLVELLASSHCLGRAPESQAEFRVPL